MTFLVLSLFLLFLFPSVLIGAKTPSLNEIKELRNSDLDEIFESTMDKSQPVNPEMPNIPTEQTSAMSGNGGMMRGSEYGGRVGNGPREVPIDHGHALGPQPGAQRPTNTEFSQLAQQGANVFANGANVLYRGAASVGQAFGIPQTNYQVPLFSQAASFFGR